MLIFKKFCIRKADVIEATMKNVEVNLSTNRVNVFIRSLDDARSEMRMDLDADEAKRLHKLLGVALTGIDGAEGE